MSDKTKNVSSLVLSLLNQVQWGVREAPPLAGRQLTVQVNATHLYLTDRGAPTIQVSCSDASSVQPSGGV